MFKVFVVFFWFNQGIAPSAGTRSDDSGGLTGGGGAAAGGGWHNHDGTGGWIGDGGGGHQHVGTAGGNDGGGGGLKQNSWRQHQHYMPKDHPIHQRRHDYMWCRYCHLKTRPPNSPAEGPDAVCCLAVITLCCSTK